MNSAAILSQQTFPGTKQELLNAMLAAFSECVFLFDVKEKRLAFISQHLVGALGHPAGADILGDGNFHRLLHPLDRRMVNLNAIKTLHGEQKVGNINIRVQQYDGSYRWFSLRQVIFDPSKGTEARYLFGVLVDIHTRKEAELQIRQQNDAIRKYVFTTSHILRAPLANILAISNLLAELKSMEEDERRSWTQKLQVSAVQLDSIITDLVLHMPARLKQ